MKNVRLMSVLMLAGIVAAAATIHADVRTDQKTRLQFGGALGGLINMFGGGDAETSSVAVKGDRKATLNDKTGQIIDLQEEKIYDLDMKKKTYKVTTFAEIRRRMEEAQQKAKERAEKSEPRTQEPAQPDPNAKQMEVDFKIDNTGQSKVINGFDTKQAIMTITVREKGKTLEQSGGLVLKSDMWLTPTIAAMKEIGEFELRYAKQLYGSMLSGVPADQMAMALAMYPMMKDAIAKMNTEGGKIEGTAVQTTMTLEAVPSAEAAKEAAASEERNQSKPKGLGGMLGGMMAKKMGQNKADEGKGSPFMTSTNEVLKVTTDVTAADVAVPAGFKETK
jgi:hypothetical protein